MRRNLKLIFEVVEPDTKDTVVEKSQTYLVFDSEEMAKYVADAAPLDTALARKKYAEELIDAGMVLIRKHTAEKIIDWAHRNVI